MVSEKVVGGGRIMYLSRYLDQDTRQRLGVSVALGALRKTRAVIGMLEEIGYRVDCVSSVAAESERSSYRPKVRRLAGQRRVIIPVILSWLPSIIRYALVVVGTSYNAVKQASGTNYRVVMFHNYNPDTVIPAVLAAKVAKCRLVGEIEEDYEYDPNLGCCYRWIAGILRKTVKCDCVVAVNRNIAERCASEKRIIIPGLIADTRRSESRILQQPVAEVVSSRKEVMFSARLDKVRGFPQLCNVVEELEEESIECRVVIFGYGSDSEIRRAENETGKLSDYCNNVKVCYLGKLAYSDYVSLLGSVPIVLNLVGNFTFQDYNFPSKVLEYLGAGRVIVSHPYPVVESVVPDDTVLFAESRRVESVVEQMQWVWRFPKEAAHRARKGREWVLRECSFDAVEKQLARAVG